MSKKATIHGRELMHVLRAFMQYHGSAVLRQWGCCCILRHAHSRYRARLPARGRYEVADPVFADAA